MADKKISELTAITGSNTAATDVFVVVDTSTGQTKKITREELNNAIEQDVLSTVDINGGTIDNTVIGSTTSAGASFTDVNIAPASGFARLEMGGASGAYIDMKAPFSDDYDGRIIHDGSNLTLSTSSGGGNLVFQVADQTKMSVISTGIDVTGTVTADGLTVDGDSQFGNSGFITFNNSNPDITLKSVGGNSSYGNVILDANGRYGSIQFRTGYDGSAIDNEQRMKIDTNGDISFYEDTGTTAKLFWDASAERLGIGTSSPDKALTISASDSQVRLYDADGTNQFASFQSDNGTTKITSRNNTSHGTIAFQRYNGTTVAESMRIDSSGNVLISTTSSDPRNFTGGASGVKLGSDQPEFAVGTMFINSSYTSDGDIVSFRKEGSTVGSIGVIANRPYIGSNDCGISFGALDILPTDGANRIDNAKDVGSSMFRWDDVYATNTTIIGTSDANEKQQIASLTDAEVTAAKALSKLFKTFKWNSAVESKGDNARTHTGHIAQDIQQAMTDAGLDAGDYAFFISTTWWETQTEVPAVEADEENGIEAVDAYTRTDTYETAEEAPEGATERTRLGVRYAELLAFIGAATEQRLTNIEARLTALEN